MKPASSPTPFQGNPLQGSAVSPKGPSSAAGADLGLVGLSEARPLPPKGPRTTLCLSLLLIAVLLCPPAFALPTPAASPAPPPSQSSATSQSAPEPESESPGATASDPHDLTKHLRIKADPAPTVGSHTNAAPKQKDFDFQTQCRGWNGLHLEVVQKTPLQDPFAEVRAALYGNTNSYRIFHLEELKMSGKLGGKLALDGAAFSAGREFEGFDNGFELRRARIYAQGDCVLVLPVSYQLEVGYVPDQFYIEQSYLAFKKIPWIGKLQIGQYQAPMSLDVVTSTRDITFMEPAAPAQALAPGVDAGVEIGRPVFDQRATWALGLFTDGVGNDFGDASKDYGRLIGRFTGLPLYDPDPAQPGRERLLHLGLSANLLYSPSSTVRYRTRPESHLAPYVLDTGDLSARSALVFGGEAAWVNGPFSAQGEYLHSFVDDVSGDPLAFHGFYGAVSWFVTGESRRYDRAAGKFTRVLPSHPFNWGKGGWGALELAGRFSYTDLESGDVDGGRLAMVGAGVNWYPHSHVKWRLNYGFGVVNGRHPEGNFNILQTRVEIDF